MFFWFFCLGFELFIIFMWEVMFRDVEWWEFGVVLFFLLFVLMCKVWFCLILVFEGWGVVDGDLVILGDVLLFVLDVFDVLLLEFDFVLIMFIDWGGVFVLFLFLFVLLRVVSFFWCVLVFEVLRLDCWFVVFVVMDICLIGIFGGVMFGIIFLFWLWCVCFFRFDVVLFLVLDFIVVLWRGFFVEVGIVWGCFEGSVEGVEGLIMGWLGFG